MVLGIILIVLVIAFIVWRAFRNTPEHKGKEGELHVHNILAQLPEEYTVLDDVVLKTNSGTTQIDHVVVSRYGVFAIETKNYRVLTGSPSWERGTGIPTTVSRTSTGTK